MKLWKKTISLALTSTIIVSAVITSGINSVFAKEDTSKEKDYIVLTDSEHALESALKLSSDSEILLDIDSDDTVVSKLSLSSDEVSRLKQIDGVVAVEKDITLTGSATETDEVDVIDYLFKDVDTDDLNLWYLDAVGSDDSNGKKRVKIELLDSGVNVNSDIEVKKRINLIEDDYVNPLYEDFSGHGTSLASVIGAKDNGEGVTGINPNAKIYSVRVLDDNIQAPLSRIIEGIQWGIDNNMDIINMSFGTNTNSAILREVIQKADEAGILLVSATGNDPDSGVQYPAAYPEVLAVGSMNENSEISDFTSVGDEMDVVAPGEKIETAGIFGTINGISGTSISTAEVSAVASKILERDKSKSPDFVKGLILASAKKIQDGDITTGAIDCNYALEIYDEYEKSYVPNKNVQEYVNPNDTTSYNTDGFVTGLWKQGDHGTLAESAAKNNLDLTKNQLNLVIAGAKAADSDNIDGYKKFKETSGLHGHGNYVANLRCALKFVDVMDNKKNIDTAYEKAQELAESLPAYKKSSDAQKLDDLLECLWNLDIIDFSTAFNVNDTLSAAAVKYKALGLCMHIAGDTYAHRVQVPKSYDKKDKIINSNYFKKLSSFSDDDDAIKQALIDAAQENNVPKKFRYLEPLQKSISYGVVEFRDIRLYCQDWYDVDSDCDVNKQFADNTTFYARRFDDAETVCDAIMCTIAYEGKFVLDYTDIVPPVSSNNTNVKLANLKSYVANAGFNTSILLDWDSYTMYPKKVGSNGKIVNK